MLTARNEQHAVVMRDVVVSSKGVDEWATVFCAGSKCSGEETIIISGATMTIPTGNIYGLIGPSGCGKSTLLNCILGRTKVSKGVVSVFGVRPGTIKTGLPCTKIGFMPQDIAINFDLRVSETIHLYGGILGLSSSQIKAKQQFLMALLDLPPLDSFIDTLSCGQQRRISLAVTLLNDPELLILDEPTVGVDPILRKQIWHYLLELTADKNHTVLITTHYVEEARMAHTVGMMRNGAIICEGIPDDIISKYNCTSLENAFLRCLQHTASETQTPKTVPLAPLSDYICYAGTSSSGNAGRYQQLLSSLPKYHRMRALLICNLKKFYRHAGHVLTPLAIPVVLMIVFRLSFGEFPKNIPFGVINHDNNYGSVYLSYLNSDILSLRHFTAYEDAFRSVKTGETWGFMEIHSNFTDYLYERFLHRFDNAFDDTTNHGGISISMDATCELKLFHLTFLCGFRNFTFCTLYKILLFVICGSSI